MLWMFLYCKSFRSSEIDCWAHFMPTWTLEEKTKSLLTPIFEPFTRDFKSCMLLRWRLSPRRWENWKRNGLTSIPKIRGIRRETGIRYYARLKKQRLTNLSEDVARMNWWCHFEIVCWGQPSRRKTKSLLTPTFASLRELSNVAYSYPGVSYGCCDSPKLWKKMENFLYQDVNSQRRLEIECRCGYCGLLLSRSVILNSGPARHVSRYDK